MGYNSEMKAKDRVDIISMSHHSVVVLGERSSKTKKVIIAAEDEEDSQVVYNMAEVFIPYCMLRGSL